MSVVLKEYLSFIPQLREQTIEKLLVLPVEEQSSPFGIILTHSFQIPHHLHKILIMTHQIEDISLPVKDVGLGWTLSSPTGSNVSQLVLTNNRVSLFGQRLDDLILHPRKPKETKRDEPLERLDFLKTDATGDKANDFY